jgi:long-chain acyl-CoA synthetase
MISPEPAYPWLAHYPRGIDWHTQLSGRPLYTILDDAAGSWPENIALEFFGKTYTYARLREMVNRIARGLHEIGVGKGTKVGLFLPNCPQFVMAYFAILKTGATVVNFNPLYSEKEISHQLQDADVEVMFTVNLANIYPKLAPFIGKGRLRKVVGCKFEEAMPLTKRALFMAAKAKDIIHYPRDEYHVLLNELLQYPDLIVPPKLDPERDIAVLQYTGGTTGVPKGAVLTHSNLYINTIQCTLWMHGLEPGREKMLAILPFFHVFAMTVAMNLAIYNGLEIIIHPRFDLKRVLDDIDKKRPTLVPGVSTLYATINNYKQLDRYDLTSIKMCISGGGPLPVDVKEQFEKITQCKLVEGYGLTESSPVVSCNPLFAENRTGTIGLPLPGTIIEIVSLEDGKTVVAPGEIGEVCIRGPQVMLGYYNKPEETAKVLKNGRLHTGDIGKMDEKGYFQIVDRLKEMIIVGGYNVYPRNIEEVLYAHEAVAECAVVGLKHGTRGETIKAYIVLKEGMKAEESGMKEYMRSRMSAYAVPHYVEFRESLPKSPVGKILKKELVAEESAKLSS